MLQLWQQECVYAGIHPRQERHSRGLALPVRIYALLWACFEDADLIALSVNLVLPSLRISRGTQLFGLLLLTIDPSYHGLSNHPAKPNSSALAKFRFLRSIALKISGARMRTLRWRISTNQELMMNHNTSRYDTKMHINTRTSLDHSSRLRRTTTSVLKKVKPKRTLLSAGIWV